MKEKKKNPSFTYEIILVDDGSKDKTTSMGLSYIEKESIERIRVFTLKKNRGKGGAVKRGMLVSRGRHLLMVDADGATKFSDLDRLERKMKEIEKNGFGIVVGSRAHLQDEVVVKRTFLRNFLMYGLHFLVWLLCSKNVKDTQCGFKLFSRDAARLLFLSQHIERWAFDLELLYLAEHFKIPVAECAVNWTDIEGSKLSPLDASFQIARDLLRIRAFYFFGLWKIKNNLKRQAMRPKSTSGAKAGFDPEVGTCSS